MRRIHRRQVVFLRKHPTPSRRKPPPEQADRGARAETPRRSDGSPPPRQNLAAFSGGPCPRRANLLPGSHERLAAAASPSFFPRSDFPSRHRACPISGAICGRHIAVVFSADPFARRDSRLPNFERPLQPPNRLLSPGHHPCRPARASPRPGSHPSHPARLEPRPGDDLGPQSHRFPQPGEDLCHLTHVVPRLGKGLEHPARVLPRPRLEAGPPAYGAPRSRWGWCLDRQEKRRSARQNSGRAGIPPIKRWKTPTNRYPYELMSHRALWSFATQFSY